MACVGFVIKLRSVRYGNYTRRRIDREASIGVIGQGVGHGVGGCIAVDREGCQADNGTGRRVLVDSIASTVRICGQRYVELVQVVDRNDKVLGESRTGCIDDLDCNRVRRMVFTIEQHCISDGDLTRVINGEAATG